MSISVLQKYLLMFACRVAVPKGSGGRREYGGGSEQQLEHHQQQQQQQEREDREGVTVRVHNDDIHAFDDVIALFMEINIPHHAVSAGLTVERVGGGERRSRGRFSFAAPP